MVHRIRRNSHPDPGRNSVAPRQAPRISDVLRRELQVAFFQRELGAPVRIGTQFVLVGDPSHRSRLIALDTVVRTFVSNPEIEYFADNSVRYNIGPKVHAVLGVVKYDKTLRRYLVRDHNLWLCLRTALCENCLRPHTEHAGDKCLFESTCWVEHMPNDKQYIYESN